MLFTNIYGPLLTIVSFIDDHQWYHKKNYLINRYFAEVFMLLLEKREVCKCPYTEMKKRLIKKRISIDLVDKKLLFIREVFKRKDMELLEFLLKIHYILNIDEIFFDSNISEMSFLDDDIKMVELLCNYNVFDIDNVNNLLYSFINNHYNKCFRMFIDNEKLVDKYNINGDPEWFYLIYKSNNMELLKYLINDYYYHKKYHIYNKFGKKSYKYVQIKQRFFEDVIKNRHLEFIRLMCKIPPFILMEDDINNYNNGGILDYAIKYQDIDIIKMIIPADIRHNADKFLSYKNALKTNNTEIIELFKSKYQIYMTSSEVISLID